MKDFEISLDREPQLDSPILIEGLPGVGNVGRLCAEHMTKVFQAEEIGHLYSTSFPHQVQTLQDATVQRMGNPLHACGEPREMIILSGDMQPLPTHFQSHYEMAWTIIDFSKERNVEMMMSLGGYSSQPDEGSRKVQAVFSSPELAHKLGELDLDLEKPETGTPIVGISGLVPALSPRQGIDSICLLGESEEKMKPDVEAASQVLNRISAILEVEIDLSSLEDSAKSIEKEMDDIIERVQRMGKIKLNLGESGEHYIH